LFDCQGRQIASVCSAQDKAYVDCETLAGAACAVPAKCEAAIHDACEKANTAMSSCFDNL
jgi:hypothetical protein